MSSKVLSNSRYVVSDMRSNAAVMPYPWILAPYVR